jgi:hypothetical protein
VAMSNTDRKINYAVRPSKSVERKMLAKIFERLQHFARLDEYVYVGFGSKYFTDFSYFHKVLNFSNMISIESDRTNKKRYEFNAPFRCVKVKFGRSTEVLPTLSELSNHRTVTWLDYDECPKKYMLEDLSILLGMVKSGSIVALSYNSKPPSMFELKDEFGDLEDGYFRSHLRQMFDSDSIVRESLVDSGLGIWANYRSELQKIFYRHVGTYLADRNTSLEGIDKYQFTQLGNFAYRDGAPMSTLVFIVYKESEVSNFRSAKFGDFMFYRCSNADYLINVPNLTIKEVMCLSGIMPITESEIMMDPKLWDDKIFTAEDVRSFSDIYNFHPSFLEVEGV